MAAGVGLYRSGAQHEVEIKKSRELHEISMGIARQQHAKDLQTLKQTYLLQLFNNLEQHFQQLNADLISSSRESERDMFDQRNQGFQTLILASSVMFSALSTIIVEGYLEENASEIFFVAYALTSALSFAFLFLCMVLCMEIVMRSSKFMYNRADEHSEQLTKAIKITQKMMKEIRGQPNIAESEYNPATARSLTENELKNRKNIESRRIIANLTSEGLTKEWDKHEAEIHGYLRGRSEININAAKFMEDDYSFQKFWDDSCKYWAEVALLFFYAGSLNLLLALTIFMWSYFKLRYNSIVSAIIGISLVAFALVVGIVLVVYLKHQNSVQKRKDLESRLMREEESSIGTSSYMDRRQMTRDHFANVSAKSTNSFPDRDNNQGSNYDVEMGTTPNNGFFGADIHRSQSYGFLHQEPMQDEQKGDMYDDEISVSTAGKSAGVFGKLQKAVGIGRPNKPRSSTSSHSRGNLRRMDSTEMEREQMQRYKKARFFGTSAAFNDDAGSDSMDATETNRWSMTAQRTRDDHLHSWDTAGWTTAAARPMETPNHSPGLHQLTMVTTMHGVETKSDAEGEIVRNSTATKPIVHQKLFATPAKECDPIRPKNTPSSVSNSVATNHTQLMPFFK